MNLSNEINILKEKLLTSKNIVITSHKNPDGDAIGSALGFYNFLLQFYNHNNLKPESLAVIIPNEAPENITWLPESKEIIYYSNSKELADDKLNSCDLFFSLDYNALTRIDAFSGKVNSASFFKVMIDHHPYPESYVDLAFNIITVSSTAELLFNVLTELNHECINKNVAVCLYTGILTDTGCFSFNSSNPGTFYVVSELLKHQINRDEIYYNVYHNYTADRYKLLGHALSKRLVHLPGFRTAFIHLSANDLKEFNFKQGDTEGFVNYPLSIKNVVFSALFTEKDNMIRISFRSKGRFPVNEFSENHFNGGGHNNAAGGESQLSLDETVNKFVNLLENYREKLVSS